MHTTKNNEWLGLNSTKEKCFKGDKNLLATLSFNGLVALWDMSLVKFVTLWGWSVIKFAILWGLSLTGFVELQWGVSLIRLIASWGFVT